MQAISGKNSKQLAFLLNFIVRYIGVRKLSKTLTHVASTVIGESYLYFVSHGFDVYMYISYSKYKKKIMMLSSCIFLVRKMY